MDNSPNLLEQAQTEFPVLKNYNIGFKQNIGGGDGYMESWPADEPGTADRPRPKEFEIGQFGVENYRPDSKPIDVAADITSHHLINSDPFVRGVFQNFKGSITPEQKKTLQSQYEHAKEHEGETRSYEAWEKNTGLPAALRGYAFKQWPEEFNNKFYTPEQKDMLDGMLDYLKSGTPTIGMRPAPNSGQQ